MPLLLNDIPIVVQFCSNFAGQIVARLHKQNCRTRVTQRKFRKFYSKEAVKQKPSLSGTEKGSFQNWRTNDFLLRKVQETQACQDRRKPLFPMKGCPQFNNCGAPDSLCSHMEPRYFQCLGPKLFAQRLKVEVSCLASSKFMPSNVLTEPGPVCCTGPIVLLGGHCPCSGTRKVS